MVRQNLRNFRINWDDPDYSSLPIWNAIKWRYENAERGRGHHRRHGPQLRPTEDLE